MARNKIQFQRGLSETGFAQLYGNEKQCRGALEQWRWPNGFICPECGATKSSFLAPRRLYQCADCGRQTSVTAGTIFHRTKLPLTTWFRAMYLMTQSKNGVSAMELMRRLDVNYDTAWKLKHKLAQVMPVGLLFGVADAATAGPPCWAPAHGHRAKHATSRSRHCYRERSHRSSHARRWPRRHEHRVHEHHVYHHEVPPTQEPYEPYASTEPASTNVTIAVGDGSSPAGSGSVTVGSVVGAALGGLLGSNVGNGNGQLAATAAGTLAGWVIGGKVGVARE